jgi:hypothetical protein
MTIKPGFSLGIRIHFRNHLCSSRENTSLLSQIPNFKLASSKYFSSAKAPSSPLHYFAASKPIYTKISLPVRQSPTDLEISNHSPLFRYQFSFDIDFPRRQFSISREKAPGNQGPDLLISNTGKQNVTSLQAEDHMTSKKSDIQENGWYPTPQDCSMPRSRMNCI